MKKISRMSVLLASLCCVTQVHAQQAETVVKKNVVADAATAALAAEQKLAKMAGRATGRVIYSGVTLISAVEASDKNATANQQRADMAIVVDGEKIHAILPATQLDATLTKGAEIIDARSLFAIPGLIDSHVHYVTQPARAYAEAELKRDLYGGLTGVRDMAGDARALADLARAALVNEIPSPDIFYAALVAGPSFFMDPRTVSSSLGLQPGQVPWLYAVTEKSDLPLVVAQARGTGATGLKIYANLPGSLVKGLIQEAKRQAFPVWTHLQVYPATPYDSLGATTVSHIGMICRYVRQPEKLSYQRSPEPSYAGLTAADPDVAKYIKALAASGTMVDATLDLYQAPAKPDAKALPFMRCPIALAGDIVHEMQRAGIRIIAGTDVDAGPDDSYPALYGELDVLVRHAGLSPYEAIVAATRNAATALSKGEEFGTLEPGKYANMVLLKDDPTQNIANLKSLVLTVKRGLRFPRHDYQHQTIPTPPD